MVSQVSKVYSEEGRKQGGAVVGASFVIRVYHVYDDINMKLG
jgi:hypothetical protein